MHPAPEGRYVALVLRIAESPGGGWSILVDGADGRHDLPLRPATFVLRLWYGADGQVIRGLVGLHGEDEWAPVQANTRIEQIVRRWLLGGEPGGE